MHDKVVLIVEDDIFTSMDLEDFARHAGFIVEVAGTGEQAIKLAEKNPPDLVLLDLTLPRMTGYDCLCELRRRGMDAPALIVTSANTDRVRDTLADCRLSVLEVMSKPCNHSTLAKHFLDVLYTPQTAAA